MCANRGALASISKYYRADDASLLPTLSDQRLHVCQRETSPVAWIRAAFVRCCPASRHVYETEFSYMRFEAPQAHHVAVTAPTALLGVKAELDEPRGMTVRLMIPCQLRWLV